MDSVYANGVELVFGDIIQRKGTLTGPIDLDFLKNILPGLMEGISLYFDVQIGRGKSTLQSFTQFTSSNSQPNRPSNCR